MVGLSCLFWFCCGTDFGEWWRLGVWRFSGLLALGVIVFLSLLW